MTGFEDDETNQVEAQGETALYSHGRIVQVQGAANLYKVPTSYAYDYEDTINLNLSPQYISQFVPIASGSSTFGSASTETVVAQDSSDTFIYSIDTLNYGDGTGANTFSTIQIYNGSAWIFVDPAGKWAQGSYTWSGSAYVYAALTYNKKIIELLSENILYNQSESVLTLGGNSALSETDKYYSGSTKLKFMNPLAKLEDSDGKEYILMRGAFNLVMDEWELTMVQVKYEVPSTVTIGTKTTRSQG